MTGDIVARACTIVPADAPAAEPEDAESMIDRTSGVDRAHPAGPFDDVRPRRPAVHPDVLGVIFLGGFLGGWLRYAGVSAWPAGPDEVPWAVVAVNLVGAFFLAGLVVVVTALRPSRYLRPLLGTGFCGALTTFSSVVVSAAQLVSDGHSDVAATYLAANVVGGLAAAVLGLVLARAVVERRRGRGRR